MDKDGVDKITLEEYMQRAGLNSTAEWRARKYRGVQQQKSGRWGAVIRDSIKGARVWLGTYHTAEAAARAYDHASLEIRGSKARLNFPENMRVLPPASQPTEVPVLSSKAANASPLTSNLQAQHLYSEASGDDFPESTWLLQLLGVELHYNMEVESEKLEDSRGVELHSNKEVEWEKLEDSPQQLIHVDTSYSASHVNPEEGNVVPNHVEDRSNTMKGPVEGDGITIRFHDREKHFGKPLNVAGEDTPQQLIHDDASYSASHVNPEEGNVAPNPVEDRSNTMKGQVEGDRINISFRDLEKHFGKPLNVAAENIGVSRSTMKRTCRKNGIFRWPSHKRNKYSHFCRSQQDGDGLIRTLRRSPYRNTSIIQDDGSTLAHQIPGPEATVENCRIVIIKASYEDTMMKFQLSIASKLSELEEEVEKRLNLKVGGFNMVYQDEDNDSITILCDTDLRFCFKSLTSHGKDTVRMIVKPHHKE